MLLCDPDFRHEAAELQAALRPHEGQENIEANLKAAKELADRWNIPFRGGHDPWYLTEAPYTCNPAVGFERLAVQHNPRVLPPFLQVTIDVRTPDDRIEEEVLQHVRRVRGEGDVVLKKEQRDWLRDVEKWERRLDVHERRLKKMKYSRIAKDLRYRGDESTLRHQAREVRDALKIQKYLRILPHSYLKPRPLAVRP